MMTSTSLDRRDFTPAALLRNPHVMTVFPGLWPRRALLAGVPTESRLFTIEPHTQLLGFCYWQPHRTAPRNLQQVVCTETSTPGCVVSCPDLLPDVQIARTYCRTVSWAFVKHSGQDVCVSASSSGFTPWVSRYACGVIQSLRPGDNRVSSRTSLQPQQMGSSVGAMNVSLLGAEGESRVVRIMVFSIDIKHLLSCPVDGGVCDTGL
jgi:hypothetical protein